MPGGGGIEATMVRGVNASQEMHLPYVSSSVSTARERVCAELGTAGLGEREVEDTALAVSELVGNALRHAQPLPSGQIRINWQVQEDHVDVAVSDGGSSSTPTRESLYVSTTPGGRGLGIVDHVAEAWGVHQDGDVTTVWAIIPARALAASG